MFMGEKFGCDLIWEGYLVIEIYVVEIEVDVVFYEIYLLLGCVLSFDVG